MLRGILEQHQTRAIEFWAKHRQPSGHCQGERAYEGLASPEGLSEVVHCSHHFLTWRSLFSIEALALTRQFAFVVQA